MPRGRPRKSANDVLLKSAELIGWALGGLEREIVVTKDRLAALTSQAAALRKKMGKGGAVQDTTAAAEGGRTRRRRTMSPEARKRISEMMKKRWAERRKGK
jgi:hypothetical protein